MSQSEAVTFTYKYPRPALTVDAAIFRKTSSGREVLLIQRKFQPFADSWALPGGFVDEDETLESAIHRELEEETGLTNLQLRQLHAFSAHGRDPRGHTVSVVFFSMINKNISTRAGDDAKKTAWFDISKLPKLAFDHQEIVNMAISRLSEL